MLSYEDLIKALEAEKVKLPEALKAEKSNTLKMRMWLTKQLSSQSEEKRMQIKLSDELQAALSHHQRVVEERDRLTGLLRDGKEPQVSVQSFGSTIETEMAKKLSNRLQD